MFQKSLQELDEHSRWFENRQISDQLELVDPVAVENLHLKFVSLQHLLRNLQMSIIDVLAKIDQLRFSHGNSWKNFKLFDVVDFERVPEIQSKLQFEIATLQQNVQNCVDLLTSLQEKELYNKLPETSNDLEKIHLDFARLLEISQKRQQFLQKIQEVVYHCIKNGSDDLQMRKIGETLDEMENLRNEAKICLENVPAFDILNLKKLTVNISVRYIK